MSHHASGPNFDFPRGDGLPQLLWVNDNTTCKATRGSPDKYSGS